MKKVTIKLPLTRNEKDDVVVGLTGRPYLLTRGVPVQVAAPIAKILERREKMLSAAMDFEAQASAPLEGM